MKKINHLVVFTILFAFNVSAQNKATTSLKNVTTICSLMSEGDGGRITKDAPLILHMHDSTNNRDVEIIFSEMMRKKMSYDPYDKLVNQKACISGKLTEYNNMPAIIIKSEKQIKTSDVNQVNRMKSNG